MFEFRIQLFRTIYELYNIEMIHYTKHYKIAFSTLHNGIVSSIRYGQLGSH